MKARYSQNMIDKLKPNFEAPVAVDKEILEQHATFCRLVNDVVIDTLTRYPHHAQNDWTCECYRSIESFLRKFPTGEDRKNILDELSAVDQTRQEVSKEWPQLFDEWPGVIEDQADL